MQRASVFAGPLLCFALAAFTFGALHADPEGPAWVLVGLDRWVGPSPAAQAALTWKIFAVTGLLWAGVAARRARRLRDDRPPG
jgi:hypothetical protein